MNVADIINQPIFQLIVEIIIFTILTVIGMFIHKKIKSSSNRYLNPHEFLPEGEIHSLKQMFYLIMMALSFIIIIYTLTFVVDDVLYIVIFDILLSLFIAVTLDKTSIKGKILFLLLVPFGSLTYMLFGFTLISLLDIIHVFIFLYFIKYYFDKFREYTTSNGLGLAVILLFSIIFISFFITQFAEHVNALDSLVMVSNAFTSNGYTVLGKTIPGKLNSLFLVWGGYIISGAGTATLTAAILIRHFNKRVEELEKIIEGESGE
ncbi:hypothetical protein [uncultured Methanobrevibacter sp.]|uniref:hypothetical protein n=1 Tax=uncultured Methanobrevibacter sp. TaxID=253161 RepID=UPI0025FB9BBC|nr:hypothetical protein [uncultured Methanobrevibacter sp.]MEE1133653.1 hypothetical protein [Methanobrevibacter sp.]MEE3489288.1 hypothetical protein [Methanobrevibacter sp.]